LVFRRVELEGRDGGGNESNPPESTEDSNIAKEGCAMFRDVGVLTGHVKVQLEKAEPV
jgi:hypothetical protein